MSKIDKPNLANIAPLTNTMVILFIWLNFLVGLSIYIKAPNYGLIIINSYLLSYIWAAVFVLLSLLLLIGKLKNSWALIKLILSVGLFVKLIFTYALIVLGFQVGFKNIIGIITLWLGITWVQFFTVKYFNLPGGKYAK